MSCFLRSRCGERAGVVESTRFLGWQDRDLPEAAPWMRQAGAGPCWEHLGVPPKRTLMAVGECSIVGSALRQPSPDGRLAPGFGQSARAGLPIWGLVGPLTLVLWPRSERGLRGVSALGSRTWRGPHSLFIPLPARCPHVLNCANGDRAAGTPGAVAYRQAASYLADGAACPEDVVPDADLTPFWISADPPFPGSSESQV